MSNCAASTDEIPALAQKAVSLAKEAAKEALINRGFNDLR
jgi:hypothetical protein